MEIERKEFPFVMEEKGLDSEARTFKGYAAVMGNLDDGGDIIEYGAFKKSIAEMGDRVKLYWIHKFDEPIGRVLELSEQLKDKLPAALLERAPDATGGLFVKGYISDVPIGDRALTQMREGVLDELSIGFKAVKEDYKDREGRSVRHLQECRLLDISPVPLAMNVGAIITDVKEYKVEETEDYIHVPVPGEEGKHDGHRIRTIAISADQGIQARYCGECKKNINYLFAKAKGWTREKAVAWVKEHSKEIDMDEIEYKGVIPFQDLPLADEGRAWDAGAARARMASWAGGPDKDKVSWSKYRRGFVWVDSDQADNYGGYRLPIADVIDGRLTAVPKGIFACAVVLQGGRRLPDVDVAACKRHIARYYRKMDREPPWEKASPDAALLEDLMLAFPERKDEIMAILVDTAQEPPLGALPATRKASREARLRLEKAKLYTEVWNDVDEITGRVP